MNDRILLSHGGGGEMTRELLRDVIYPAFGSQEENQDDAALISTGGTLAFTTDSFVVSPYFFQGGDIGKLAVCGTVNDLCCAGAQPQYLSCGFILEEGLPIQDLAYIVRSMAETAAKCGVRIVTGDTKVVPKGSGDGIYINTSGIGQTLPGFKLSGTYAKPGDAILISGTVGMHGCAILMERESVLSRAEVESDCAPVLPLLLSLTELAEHVHVLRDPTRGGLAATLNEIALQSNAGLELMESEIPIQSAVRGICAVTGVDPLQLACEGRLIAIVEGGYEQKVLSAWRQTSLSADAACIGHVTASHPGVVALETSVGGKRVLRMPVGELLPRIC